MSFRGTDPARLAEDICSGKRRALARAITLIESSRLDHQARAESLLHILLPRTGGSIRLGVSGAPGVGKSTFIEAFGMHLLEQGKQLAVLSIDPSSALSGGSILGDKTRMENLARSPRAFIRPSPAGRTLGGVARRTREVMLLVEAAGFDVVIVETVGVGQSEIAVADMTDMFLLLLQPGGGDELQGIKRGIMELADLVLVNKADGELLAPARRSAAEYANALRLLQPRSANWKAEVKLCSSVTDEGIAEVWSNVTDYRERLAASGEFSERRAAQARSWLWQELSSSLLRVLRAHPGVRSRVTDLELAVSSGRILPASAAHELLDLFLAD